MVEATLKKRGQLFPTYDFQKSALVRFQCSCNPKVMYKVPP